MRGKSRRPEGIARIDDDRFGAVVSVWSQRGGGPRGIGPEPEPSRPKPAGKAKIRGIVRARRIAVIRWSIETAVRVLAVPHKYVVRTQVLHQRHSRRWFQIRPTRRCLELRLLTRVHQWVAPHGR